MKTSTLLILASLLAIAVSCKKNSEKPNYSLSLTGKWNLAVDTIATGGAIVNYYGYQGITGDYFDFRSDGKCYIKEGSHLDTLAYSITSDTSLNIESFGFSDKAIYTKPVAPYTSVRIISTGPYVPGGYDYRMVRLTR